MITEEQKKLIKLENIISYLESTTEESWCEDVVKTKDGKNCLFGHLFDYGGGDKGNGAFVYEMFEELYATTYMVFPVNDGEVEKYNQPTPKQRCIAYLKDLLNGTEKTTQKLIKETFENYL